MTDVYPEGGTRAHVGTALARQVAIVTPWYPTRELPFRGAFVRAMVDATAPGCDHVTVYHCDAWLASAARNRDRSIRRAHMALLPHAVKPSRTVRGADLVYIPVPTTEGLTYADIAARHAAALRAGVDGGRIAERVVHAHVGFLSGWAALTNSRPDARVFVTEHATFLDRVLEQPRARRMYDELLYRCAGLFAVGQPVRAPLVRAFPHHADRIKLIPNPISFDRPRTEPVTRLCRWLFVGALIPRKGVDYLLEAFAVCRAEDATLTLTLVGEGQLSDWLRRRAIEHGVADAVTMTGGVGPDEALALMRRHDLLVHPSRMETFGVTVIEAVAAGMPVLVTRCGGPEETLAGIEDAAGELIDVEENAESIVGGYRRLRDRFPGGLDMARARRHLAARYGYGTVARAHHSAWFPERTTQSSPDIAGLIHS